MPGNGQNIPKEILDFGKKLARAHRKTGKEITEIFLAPATDRVLLVEVDPTAILDEKGSVFPRYFRAAPAEGIPFPSGVIFVTPKQKKAQIPLPEKWGSWDQLRLIWERRGMKKRGMTK